MTTLSKNDPVKEIQSQAWYELVWHMKLSYEKAMDFIVVIGKFLSNMDTNKNYSFEAVNEIASEPEICRVSSDILFDEAKNKFLILATTTV